MIIKRICNIWIVIGILFTLSIQSISADSDLAFHEVASTVMINSLEAEKPKSFLKKLYRKLFFVPIWIDEDNLSSFARELFTLIKSDKTLEKSSQLYEDAILLQKEAKNLYSSNSIKLYPKVELEFKISQLYKGYADYTLYGSINWGAFNARLHNLKARSLNAAWDTHSPLFSPISLIEEAVMSGSLKELFVQAKPKEYGYSKLQKELIRYRNIQKNNQWQHIKLRGLKVGKSHSSVLDLRDRLRLTGDYQSCGDSEYIYTKCLKNALKRFQKRHGLIANGVMRKDTMRALNIPIKKIIEKISLNLDRIKWLNQRGQKRHIIINIPAYTLYFEENKKLIQTMRVIVGKKKNPTPIFSNTVKSIVLNPKWNIPKSIVQKEMIPKLMKNPNAMARRGIEIRLGWGKNAKKVNPKSIDWGKYRYSKTVPFHFAQVSGSRNALGKVKFLFPNRFAVYMHDTPNKKLFRRNVRAFSHGCIRLAKPRKLLETFASFNSSVNLASSKKRLKGKKRQFLGLNNKVPVDVVYLTAFVDYDGILQFRNDIYGYDRMQLHSYRKW
ncbi:MAG: L,D-transpeptidase family protein [Sulfurovum sp.]